MTEEVIASVYIDIYSISHLFLVNVTDKLGIKKSTVLFRNMKKAVNNNRIECVLAFWYFFYGQIQLFEKI